MKTIITIIFTAAFVFMFTTMLRGAQCELALEQQRLTPHTAQ